VNVWIHRPRRFCTLSWKSFRRREAID